MSANQAKNNRQDRIKTVDKEWTHEADSPIELAKMHPFIKKVLMTSNVIMLLAAIEGVFYASSELWKWDNGDVWDIVWLMMMFSPPVMHLILLKIQRTSKVREDE